MQMRCNLTLYLKLSSVTWSWLQTKAGRDDDWHSFMVDQRRSISMHAFHYFFSMSSSFIPRFSGPGVLTAPHPVV
jgi:hypothetical protein